MVRKTIQAITSKISGLHEAAFWLSLFSFFSQLLAFLRDRLLAHNFGAGKELDVYYAAFKLPDLLFVTVASLVSISALVPIFAKKETEGEKHLKDATNSIFTVFSVIIIISCVLMWFATPVIISTFFKSFSVSVQNEIIFLSRVLLLSPLFLGLSNFFGSIVQYEKRFILYSLSPLLYNLGIILGIVLLPPSFGIKGPVYGVIFGALLHLCLQASFVAMSQMRPFFTINIKWKDVLETLYLSVPRTFALSVTSFVSFFFVSLASGFSLGSISVFNFSSNIQSVPLSLIGVSFSLAAFPALAISVAKNNIDDVIQKIAEGLRQIIFWSLPLSVFIIFLRAHIVRVILGSGEFDWEATRLVAGALALFVFSSVFQSIQLFLSRSHYALGKTKWPFYGNILGGALSIIFALVFINDKVAFEPFFDFLAKALNVDDLSKDVLSLPLAYSFGSIITAFVLFFALGKRFTKEIFALLNRTIVDSVLASAVLGLGVHFMLLVSNNAFDLNTFWGVLGHGFISGIVGIALALVTLKLIGNEEYKSIVKRFGAKFK